METERVRLDVEGAPSPRAGGHYVKRLSLEKGDDGGQCLTTVPGQALAPQRPFKICLDHEEKVGSILSSVVLVRSLR